MAQIGVKTSFPSRERKRASAFGRPPHPPCALLFTRECAPLLLRVRYSDTSYLLVRFTLKTEIARPRFPPRDKGQDQPSPGFLRCLLFRRRRRRRLIISAKVNVAIKMQNISPLSLFLRPPARPSEKRSAHPILSWVSSLFFYFSAAKGSFSVSISKEHLALSPLLTPLTDRPTP